MSVIKPEIDSLLEKTEHNPFLLCTMAAKRACDINSMIRGQHLRALDAQQPSDVAAGKITVAMSDADPVSVAMEEINHGELSFVKEDFDEAIKGANKSVF